MNESLEEFIAETIQGRASKRREERQRREDFLSRWLSIRDEVVRPLFDRAAKQLRPQKFKPDVRNENGLAIYFNLSEDDPMAGGSSILRFEGRAKDLEVFMTWDQRPEESFKLDHLTPENVERHLRRFLSAFIERVD